MERGGCYLLPSDGAADSPSEWHGDIEDREHSEPLLCWKQVGYQSRSNGGIAGLSNPHQQSGSKQHPVILS